MPTIEANRQSYPWLKIMGPMVPRASSVSRPSRQLLEPKVGSLRFSNRRRFPHPRSPPLRRSRLFQSWRECQAQLHCQQVLQSLKAPEKTQARTPSTRRIPLRVRSSLPEMRTRRSTRPEEVRITRKNILLCRSLME